VFEGSAPGTTGTSAPAPSVVQASEARPAQPTPETISPQARQRVETVATDQGIGDSENALVHYRALLERSQNSAEVHNNLGVLYQNRGDVSRAIAAFEQAIRIDPNYSKAHTNLGAARLRQQKLAGVVDPR
jgi:Flp pilus assembly protein TadD